MSLDCKRSSMLSSSSLYQELIIIPDLEASWRRRKTANTDRVHCCMSATCTAHIIWILNCHITTDVNKCYRCSWEDTLKVSHCVAVLPHEEGM